MSDATTDRAVIKVDVLNTDKIHPLVHALVRIARIHGTASGYQRDIAREALAGIGIIIQDAPDA